MDITLLTAIISGSIALLGVIISASITRAQYRIQHKFQAKELELKTKEFELITNQLTAEYESLKQSQYTEVLKKRMEIYPLIWGVMVDYMINWKLEGKSRNADWVNELLVAINKCNSSIGVFFSQDFYSKFATFRHILIGIKIKCDNGVPVSDDDLQELDFLYFGSKESSGLSAILKDDLGSYGESAIQKRAN